MQLFLRLFLLTFCFWGMACSQHQLIKDSWKFTNRQYRNYLNTPATLDLSDKGSCELYELALGDAILNVDEAIFKLIRTMENSDNNPDQNWVMDVTTRFPWLSGVALVDKDGGLIAQYPEHFAKPFDVKPLLTPDPKQHLGDLRAYVQDAPGGPEVYVANPVYGGENLRGLVVAYFDPQALATLSSAPGDFVLLSPEGILWQGDYTNVEAIRAQNWGELLAQKSCGTIGDGDSGFFWTTRYVGNLPLVYAISVTAGKHLEQSALVEETAQE